MASAFSNVVVFASIGRMGGITGRSMGRYSHRVVPDPVEELGRYFAKRADAPFGDLELESGRTLQPFCIAGQRAASNLLAKAIRALDNDEPDRARSYVDRAVRLPYDRHEQSHPVATEAHMVLFCLVTDELETAEEDDSRWLEVAITAQASASEEARCTMRDVLMAVDHDYNISRAERAVLRSATADVLERPELRDLDLAPDEMGDCVMAVLDLCRAYRSAASATRP